MIKYAVLLLDLSLGYLEAEILTDDLTLEEAEEARNEYIKHYHYRNPQNIQVIQYSV